MKVLIHFRGSIGDMCLWMTKFKGLFHKYEGDDIYFVLNSRYSKKDTMTIFCENKEIFNFYGEYSSNVLSVEYHRPADIKMIRSLVPSHDCFYDFDLWDSVSVNMKPPVVGLYPDLGNDIFPVDSKKYAKNRHVVIHPEGYFVKDTWKKEYWQELINLFKKEGYKIYVTGRPYDFDNIENKKLFTFKILVKIVASADLWIGIDTGIRNLAMIFQVPVVELGTPGKGYPNYDVFHPVDYRNNSMYFRDIDILTPNFLTERIKAWTNI